MCVRQCVCVCVRQCECVCVSARPRTTTQTFRSALMDEECPFSDVTSSGRVWRKGAEKTVFIYGEIGWRSSFDDFVKTSPTKSPRHRQRRRQNIVKTSPATSPTTSSRHRQRHRQNIVKTTPTASPATSPTTPPRHREYIVNDIAKTSPILFFVKVFRKSCCAKSFGEVVEVDHAAPLIGWLVYKVTELISGHPCRSGGRIFFSRVDFLC